MDKEQKITTIQKEYQPKQPIKITHSMVENKDYILSSMQEINEGSIHHNNNISLFFLNSINNNTDQEKDDTVNTKISFLTHALISGLVNNAAWSPQNYALPIQHSIT
mmetsp:Transcript_35368/g.35575  ORF Transcript_35368/g.35575 Transcript_35368/m.35575 type:complete len:107 (-) Transcript_35368:73-393(-)